MCWRWFVSFVVVSAVSGCAHRDTGVVADCLKDPSALDGAPRATGGPPTHDPDADVLVRALGASGLYLEWMGSGVLISPRFTVYPPSAGSLGRKLSPDVEAIEAGLAHIDAAGVQAILVDGSDYERIADLVAVAGKLPHADLYVNQSGLNLLAPEVDALEARGGDKDVRVRAVNGEALPRIADQWTWLRGTDNKEIPIRIRALAVATPNPQPAPPSQIAWDDLHTNELFEGQRHAFAVELFDEERTAVQYRMLFVGAGVEPNVAQIDEELDLLVVGLRRHAAAETRPSDLVRSVRAAHVMFLDYDLEDGKGGWSLHPDLDPKWVGTSVCSAGNAVRDTGIAQREPREKKGGVNGPFWTMPTPGQWLVFSTDDSAGLDGLAGEPEPLETAYDRALLQTTELDLQGAWGTVSKSIAEAQKGADRPDPRMARLLVLAAGIVMARDNDAAKARALADKAVLLDYWVQPPIELRDKKLMKVMAQARAAAPAPSEPVAMGDPTMGKGKVVSFEALIQTEVPEDASVVLYWRKMGEGEFESLPMERWGNVATAQLGAVSHRGSDLEFFVYVFDANQQPLANRGSQEEPQAFFPSGP